MTNTQHNLSIHDEEKARQEINRQIFKTYKTNILLIILLIALALILNISSFLNTAYTKELAIISTALFIISFIAIIIFSRKIWSLQTKLTKEAIKAILKNR